MEYTFSYLFLIFIIFSFCGYVCEIIFSSLWQKKLVNRGFLCGPYCPIYGVGSLFILFCLLRFKEDPVIVFILGAVITSCLEYFTSFLLEKIFHNKWWDYSDMKANIHGRVCLQNTLLFGLGALAVIYGAFPFVHQFIHSLSSFWKYFLTFFFLFIFVIDFVYSVFIAYNLRNRLIICEQLKNEKLAMIPGMLERIIKTKVMQFKAYPKRLLDAFPNLKKKNSRELEIMKKLRDKKRKQQSKKKSK